jgi:hypothetical protein
MVANLPVLTICDIWFQNAVIDIPLFLIKADMNIFIRAICSSIQTHNVLWFCTLHYRINNYIYLFIPEVQELKVIKKIIRKRKNLNIS